MKNNFVLTSNKTPRYVQLTAELRRQVKDGILKPGDVLPSISELRATHNISKSTIERVHLLLEQEGLIVREHGRGTFVAFPVVQPIMQPKGVIGIYGLIDAWVPASSYWARILEGVREVLQDHQGHLMLFEPDARGVQEKADGVLINGDYTRPQRQWLEEKWPCVSLLAPQATAGVSSVMADVVGGARLAVEHLVGEGHSQIAYLHNQSDTSEGRLNGYREALRAMGVRQAEEWVRGFKGMETNFYYFGREAMREWLQNGWCDLQCTAIMTHNDDVAAGAIEALSEAGLRVPDDVSVIGFDGTDVCNYTSPRLTTIEIPLREIGKYGAELLLDQIQNGVNECQHIILPTQLRVRESVAPPNSKKPVRSRKKKEVAR